MSPWILTISLGPVGGFIAAGRRSRDLWWGSTWVSQVVREVAEALTPSACNTGVTLLLPTSDSLSRTVGRHGGRVANKLVLEVQGGPDVCEALARQARTTATDWLLDQVQKGLGEARRRGHLLLNPTQCEHQIEAIRAGDFLELRAGWAELDPDDWKGSLRRATALRDATPRLFGLPTPDHGVYKCDLDPGRPSALLRVDARAEPDRWAEQQRQRVAVGVSEGEALDAIYLARRLARFYDPQGRDDKACQLGDLPFPPVGRVAAEPWLDGAGRAAPALMLALTAELERQSGLDSFSAWCSRVTPPSGGSPLPFDPAVLFEGGVEALREVLKRAGLSAMELSPVAQIVSSLRGALKSSPIPYYALLELDGDGVGHALSGLAKPAWTEAIGGLDAFSEKAAGVVEGLQGVAFYAAGDEILAYAPVDRALTIVQGLQDAWRDTAARADGLRETTLSAAVCFVHVKDDLSAARARVSEALKRAKVQKKSQAPEPERSEPWLALTDLPRAGSPRELVGPAPALLKSLDVWRNDAEHGGEEALSLRTAHILWEHARRLQITDLSAGPALRLAQGAVLGQLRRSERSSTGREASAELERRVRGLDNGCALRALVDELLVAERIARVAAQRTVGGE